MSTLLALFVLVMVGLIVGFVVKTILWLVFLPIRFLFKLIFWTLGAGFAAIVLPILLVGALVVVIGGVIAALFAMIVPLLPVILVALVGWAIYRASVGSAIAVR
jgi:hypothetical protein